MSRKAIHTERAPQAIGTYSQAVRAGDLRTFVTRQLVPALVGTGVVKELRVKLGDKLSEGSPLLLLETSDAAPASAPTPVAATRAP